MRTRKQVRSFGQDLTNLSQIQSIASQGSLNSQNIDPPLSIMKGENLSKRYRAKIRKQDQQFNLQDCLEQILIFGYGYYKGIIDQDHYVSSSNSIHQNGNQNCNGNQNQSQQKEQLQNKKINSMFPVSPQLTIAMRNILIEWLVEVHQKMSLRHETLYLTIYLIDNYCSRRLVTKSEYQLLAMTCLFIAGKYEQVATPRLKKIISLCDRLYTNSDILQMESQLLLQLNFKISQPSLNWFIGIQLYTVESSQEEQGEGWGRLGGAMDRFKRVCSYVMELCLFEIEVLKKFGPQVITNSILVTMAVRGEFLNLDVKASTRHLSAQELRQVRECGGLIRKIYGDRLNAKYNAVNNKYPDMAIPDPMDSC